MEDQGQAFLQKRFPSSARSVSMETPKEFSSSALKINPCNWNLLDFLCGRSKINGETPIFNLSAVFCLAQSITHLWAKARYWQKPLAEIGVSQAAKPIAGFCLRRHKKMNDTTQPTIPIQPDADQVSKQLIDQIIFPHAYLGKKYSPEFLDSFSEQCFKFLWDWLNANEHQQVAKVLQCAWMIKIGAVTLRNGETLDDAMAEFIAVDLPEVTKLIAALGGNFDSDSTWIHWQPSR